MLIPMEPHYSREYFVQKMRALKSDFDRIETSGEDFPDAEQGVPAPGAGSCHRVGGDERPPGACAFRTLRYVPRHADLCPGQCRCRGLTRRSISTSSMQRPRRVRSAWVSSSDCSSRQKPLGIFLASWIAMRTRFAACRGASWRMLFAVACHRRIGFTMALFVDSLAFTDVAMIDRRQDRHPHGPSGRRHLRIAAYPDFGKKRTRQK